MELPDRFTVDVTAEDIAKGVPCKPECCPVALAVRRTYKRRKVAMFSFGANISRRTFAHDAQTFVVAFDSGETVLPRRVTFERDDCD